MSAPDLALGRRFLALHPPPGEVLVCAVTGSHQYGFPSPDSDIDLKGIHQAPTEALLGLSAPAEAHDALQVFEGVECDLTTNELSQALRLLLKGNGNLLERLASPYQLVEGPALEALRDLARGARSQASHGHYAGYFLGMQREHRREPRARSLLYSYRVALTGIHLLETGEVVAHLPTLAREHGYGEVLELVAFKTQAGESDRAPADLAGRLQARWPELAARLAQARDRSPLPREAPNRAQVEAWLVARRRRALCGEPPGGSEARRRTRPEG